jgi:hypothetical protein
MSPFFAQKAAGIILAIQALGLLVFIATIERDDMVIPSKKAFAIFRLGLGILAVFFALVSSELFWW